MNEKEKLEKLIEYIKESENIVFFGGAGVSTESGIPDFRSSDGLYNMKYKYPPERIISHSFFREKTADFYEFYRDKMLFPNAKPNFCHIALAKLEAIGKLKAVITQNIDGLHEKAGSKTVYDLHGSVWRNFCERCGKAYSLEYIKNGSGVPTCSCGGTIKPDVVLYEESLNDETIENSINAIEKADFLIIGGTSLRVQPACSLVNFFHGKRLVVINKEAIGGTNRADFVVQGNIGEVFEEIIKEMRL